MRKTETIAGGQKARHDICWAQCTAMRRLCHHTYLVATPAPALYTHDLCSQAGHLTPWLAPARHFSTSPRAPPPLPFHPHHLSLRHHTAEQHTREFRACAVRTYQCLVCTKAQNEQKGVTSRFRWTAQHECEQCPNLYETRCPGANNFTVPHFAQLIF